MGNYTKQDIIQLVEEKDVQFIRLQFTDVSGNLKNVAITASQLERALDNKCPACGAPILYKPNLKKWKCDYCKSEFTLEEMKKYNNASSEKNNKKEEKIDVKDTTKNTSKDTIKKEKDNTTYVEYNCKDCGAKIIADEQTTATFCIYCGNTAILKEKLSGKFAPDLIIPFKNEKEKAIESFKSLNKGRPLMPDFFNDEKNIEKIRGVYIRFWLFDVKVTYFYVK